ncbi:IS256 family transposase [Mesorhizobium silamurunense]|uniref:IS256 family transposase n=1 Tax=Mesorhizobium silamurunense TaxID=499528 RepID=UPI0028B1F133|nr:transposase [Mesorhizobium silamurunense]
MSEATARLDEALQAFFTRRLAEPYPYLILDARYERIREAGVIAGQAVVVAIGVDWEGRRQVLGVELANRESRSSWREFVTRLKRRGLAGVEFVVSDDHPGLRAAIREMLPEAVWQRCYMHFLRNALDYVPRKVDDDCLMELRWFYDRCDLAEVERDLAHGSASGRPNTETGGLGGNNIEETLSFYRLPLPHHKHISRLTLLERLNQEIKRCTLVVASSPTRRAVCGWFGRWPWRSTRTGSRRPLPQHGSSVRA